MMKEQELPNGRTARSDRPRPYYLRTSSGRGRWFGSLAAARAAASEPGGSGGGIFFEYATGCGHFLERT